MNRESFASGTRQEQIDAMRRISEAQILIIDVRDSSAEIDSGDVPFSKSYDREPLRCSKNLEDSFSAKFNPGCSFCKWNNEGKQSSWKRIHELLSSFFSSIRQNSAGLFT